MSTVEVGVEWRALGTVEVLVNGHLVDLGPPMQRALFGLLLSRVDQPVAFDTVIEELWSGYPPAAAITSLRTYVSNLRRVLEPGRGPRKPAAVLRTRNPGYLLDSRGVEFDVQRFTRHATAGRRALGQQDPQQAVVEFDAALVLWRGQAYADMRGASWAAPVVARLDELRLSVVEARCEAQLALGQHHGVVAELDMHARAHPLREYGCQLLALALYRAGRQAEALGVLRAIRARLVGGLGIDPGIELQRLERDILTQAPTLDWRPPAATATAPAGESSADPQEFPDARTNGQTSASDIADGQRVVSTQVQGFAEVVGREDELTTLRARFTDPQRPPRPVLQVLTGLGGMGKTSLARAYAQRYQERYELVWWIRAETPEAVAGEFHALLNILAPQYAQLSGDPIQAVHAVLANRTEPWLLVIDNIAEPEALRGLLPAGGSGDVLVTSRAGTWPDRRMVLPVAPLTSPHAVRLVTMLSGDSDQVTAAVLAEELGALPLALAQAGCYVSNSALDLDGYLALYRSRRAELHQQGRAPDYPDTVATTWQLAFDQLCPSARALLNLLAWYAPDTIPLDRLLSSDTDHRELPEPVNMLLRPLLLDPLHRHRAITELITYGLLTCAGPAGSVTVHRLVQAVTADQLTAGDEYRPWVESAAVLLANVCPLWPAPRVSIAVWQSVQTHVRAVIKHLQPDQRISLNLRNTLVGWTGLNGDFVHARELAAAVVDDMLRMLGPDHRYTLLTRVDLAYWIGQAGDTRRAQEEAAAVAEDMTRVLGADHRHTLFARGGVVRWTALSGDFQRARELAAALVKDAQRVLSADDPYMLLGRAQLARWTGEAGDLNRARELTAAVVEDTQRVLGADDRYTLAARALLVRWTGQAGDVVAARELAAALVEDDERVLGADHRHTLLARSDLARWTGEAGDVVRAGELAAALLEDMMRIFGGDHPDSRAAQIQLAQWTTR
ncbi:MAG TPA: FxSxx-COOH system tetratricopeptide repeat protein [Pseudonocardiaceae bacterium]|nr:FxSxx-COOH system tetratricopeptide repeat protein [Pseudonocardiaceae bacterium]